MATASVADRLKKKADQAATRVRVRREALGKTPEGRDESSPTIKSPGTAVAAAKPNACHVTSNEPAPVIKAKYRKPKLKALFFQVRAFLANGPPRGQKSMAPTDSPGTLSIPRSGSQGRADTPRYESSSHSHLPTVQSGTSRYGSSPVPAQALVAIGTPSSHMDTPRNLRQESAQTFPGILLAAAPSASVEAVGVEHIKLSLSEIVELSEHQKSLLDAQIGRDRVFLTSMLTVEAAKWQLIRDVGVSKATSSLSLASVLKLALSKPVTHIPHELGEHNQRDDVAACLSVRQRRLGIIKDHVIADPLSVVDTDQLQHLVMKVTDAKLVVIDPNMEALTNHLHGMLDEHLGAAAAELSSARLRRVIHAKAQHVHSIIMAAMDDVESQFCGGMDQVVQKLLPNVPECDTHSLCAAVVCAHRQQMGQDYALETLERKLRKAVRDGVNTQTSAANRPLTALAVNPHEWLCDVVLGATGFGLEEDVMALLSTTVADYLDPFLDGNVPATEYRACGAGLFAKRWQLLYNAQRGVFAAEIPSEYILAQYLRHAITKMNTNLGFDAHQPGIGRQPLSKTALDHHANLLGTTLVEAIARDFDQDKRHIGSLSITPRLVTELSKAHMDAFITYQNELGIALARANRLGEEARKQERLRIWGYC